MDPRQAQPTAKLSDAAGREGHPQDNDEDVGAGRLADGRRRETHCLTLLIRTCFETRPNVVRGHIPALVSTSFSVYLAFPYHFHKFTYVDQVFAPLFTEITSQTQPHRRPSRTYLSTSACFSPNHTLSHRFLKFSYVN
jgi:hypothetical protein